MLGGVCVGERQGVEDPGREDERERRVGDARPLAASSTTRSLESVQQAAVGRDRDQRAVAARARPGRRGRARASRRSPSSRRRRRARSARRGRRSRRCPATWRLASVTKRLPGPAMTSTAGDALDPVGERGDRLRPAERVDLVDGGDARRRRERPDRTAPSVVRAARRRPPAVRRRSAPEARSSAPKTDRRRGRPARRSRPRATGLALISTRWPCSSS